MPRDKLEFPYPDENFLDEGLPKGVLSPSGFNMYRRCPRQFMFAYVRALIRPPGVAMVKGTAIHHGAEVIHKNTIKNGDLLPLAAATQSVSDAFDAEKDAITDWEDQKEGVVKDAAIRNIIIYYRQAVPLIRPIAAEKPFAVRVGSVPVRGVIDLIDVVADDYIMVEDSEKIPDIEVVTDLKTTKKLWPEQKLYQEPQLTFYALAENTTNVRVDFLLDKKSGINYVPKRALRGKNDKRLLVEDVEEVAHCIKRGVFPRCDPTSWVCNARFCGYYQQCRGPK